MTSPTRDRPLAAPPAPRRVMARRPRRILVGLELVTGATALVGGVLLAIAPDGSLLAADPAVLAGSPFADYRWPGILLATLVGAGYLVTGFWQEANAEQVPEPESLTLLLSALLGLGLIAYRHRAAS